MDVSHLISSLRRSLLIKVISSHTPTRSDISAAIEQMAAKLVDVVGAKSMSVYILDGSHISFTQVCYSPKLWAGDAEKEKRFRDSAAELLALKIPRGQGIVGRVIETGEPFFFRSSERQTAGPASMAETSGFEVYSMLLVPLKTAVTLGAIEVLNKEVPDIGVSDFDDQDLALLRELAEYLSVLIHRMLDPKFQPAGADTARYIGRLADLPVIATEDDLTVDADLPRIAGEPLIRAEHVFPYKRLGAAAVAVVMTNPLDFAQRERFSESTGLAIDDVSVVSPAIFAALVRKHFHSSATPPSDEVDIGSAAEAINDVFAGRSEQGGADLESIDSGPLIQLTNRIIEDAYVCGASDIHIEPGEKDLVVRYRVDGLCQEKLILPKRAAGALVARIKIMCNLDISETRLPQDGRIVFNRYTKKKIDVDLRVAVCPTNFGEKIVMRILDKAKSALPLTQLGFSDENLEKYRECVRQPYGMILHCGPTGSGKSMTLYSALGEVNTRDMNIQTAEDPIEYTLPGLNQTQMNRQIGLTFARALRSYLRMDPDIILVGEIRDEETAQIAVEAALTGHLLVSTLHTNDAASTVARLGEMGVEAFNISASLVCVCAQRLLRRVCKNCKVPYEPKGREQEFLVKALAWTGTVYKANPHGCPACGGLGYRSRVGIHELLVNSEELTAAINAGIETADLKRVAMRNGMKTLHQDSMLKVKGGTTTIEEALANVPPDMIATHAVPAPLAQVA
jgi:type II secretory ATPase GspE/PulE/Tfp pilus assembly ATPase PilB-like protein